MSRSGKPVSDVKLVIESGDPDNGAITDTNGAFVVTNVPAGQYTVRVLTWPGRVELAQTKVGIEANKQTSQRIEIGPSN